MAMNITRVTVGEEYPTDIKVGENNVKRIELFESNSVRVIYSDNSFLIYPMSRIFSLGGNMTRGDVWDADPRANPNGPPWRPL